MSTRGRGLGVCLADDKILGFSGNRVELQNISSGYFLSSFSEIRPQVLSGMEHKVLCRKEREGRGFGEYSSHRHSVVSSDMNDNRVDALFSVF